MGLAASGANAQSVPSFAGQPPIRETLASVTINGVFIADNVTLIEVNGLGILIAQADFDRLRLTKAMVPEVVRRDEQWVSLARLKRVKATLNQKTLELVITADPQLFPDTNIKVFDTKPIQPSPVPTGAYLNYDVLAENARGISSLRGTVEAVAFGSYGSLVSNQLFAQNSNLPTGSLIPSSQNIRLDTYFQKDFVDSLTRLKLGDAVTNPGTWGRPVRFGGVQWGTDFSLSPRFISSPLLDFRGQASLPSTVDLYVNNGLVRRYEIAPGPFSIAQIPVVSGNGEARLVVRDSLGRDVIINQPFFTVPVQLRSGLSQYSLELGALHRNFAVASNDYGSPFVSGTYRYGVSDSLTIEGRAESLLRADAGVGKLSVAGLSAVWPFAKGHFIVPTAVASQSDWGAGYQAAIQYGYSGTQIFYGLRAEKSTAGFRQIGFATGELPQEHRYSINAGVRLGRGSLALAVTDSLPRPYTIQSGPATGLIVGGVRTQVGTLSYSTSLGQGWSIAAGVSRVIAGDASSSGYLNLNYTGQDNTFASIGSSGNRTAQGNSSNSSVRAGQRPADTGGVGYDVDVSQARQRVGVQAITRAGEFAIDVVNEKNVLAGEPHTSGRISARGAVVIAGDTIAASRPIANSFIVVKAPALANSAVRTSGGAGVTLNSAGIAVLTRISAYDETQVQILPEKTPIDVTIDQFSTRVTPVAKAGAIANLAVRRTAAITFRATDEKGKSMPIGTLFEVTSNQGAVLEKGSVGLDGLVYVKDMLVGAKVYLKSRAQSCLLPLPAVPKEPLPDLGDVMCKF